MESNKKRLAGAWFLVLAGACALLLGTWHVLSPSTSPLNYLLTRTVWPAVPRPVRPVTLDPSPYAGRVREGYRIAKEQPELLERMPCYCGCYLKDGHQNNLDCFRDRHGETCDMCVAIAIRAEQLAKRGYNTDDIKAVIDRAFAPSAQP